MQDTTTEEDIAATRLERRRQIWSIFEQMRDDHSAPWSSQTAKYLQFVHSRREVVGRLIGGRAYAWSVIDRIAESSIDPVEDAVKLELLLYRQMRSCWMDEDNAIWLPNEDDFFGEPSR